LLAVSESAPSDRPWNAPRNAMMPCRFVVPRQLDGRLGRLGARVGEERPDVPLDRHDPRERLGQPDLRLVVEVGPRHVQELLRLVGDRLDHVGMRVAGRVHRDPGGAIEEAVAVHVLDDGPLAAGDDERVVAGVGGGDELRVAVDERLGLRPRQVGLDIWCLHS
jgi:hypothetical protein